MKIHTHNSVQSHSKSEWDLERTTIGSVRPNVVTPVNATKSNSTADYTLGYRREEQERLIRQAARVAPMTERLFCEAGTCPGQRVLDLGSGMGDVSMLVARLVGPSGEVVGVERDASSIARATARVAEAKLRNVSFIQGDVSQIVNEEPFDAAVGRFILMFLPDPGSVLRSVSNMVRPGGVLAFQEVSWAPCLSLARQLPLWSSVLSSIHETLLLSGANTEMGLALNSVFQQVELPAPAMHIEAPLGNDADFTENIYELLVSLLPLAQQHNVALERLGDLGTLLDRIQAEVVASNTVVTFGAPLVRAWSRKPEEGFASG